MSDTSITRYNFVSELVISLTAGKIACTYVVVIVVVVVLCMYVQMNECV